MAFSQAFEDIALANLRPVAEKCAEEGWRGVQMLCVNTDTGIDLTYTFEREGEYQNLQIRGIKPTDKVPSLQDLFFCLFPFENEAHDLFGVNVCDMALDFKGSFYSLAQPEPMTILSPAQKKERDKKAAAAAAKAATAAGATAEILTDAQIEEKVGKVPAEKQEALRIALKAKQAKQMKEAKEAAAEAAVEAPLPSQKILTDKEIEARVANLPADKAEKIRAALIAKRDAAAGKEA